MLLVLVRRNAAGKTKATLDSPQPLAPRPTSSLRPTSYCWSYSLRSRCEWRGPSGFPGFPDAAGKICGPGRLIDQLGAWNSGARFPGVACHGVHSTESWVSLLFKGGPRNPEAPPDKVCPCLSRLRRADRAPEQGWPLASKVILCGPLTTVTPTNRARRRNRVSWLHE